MSPSTVVFLAIVIAQLVTIFGFLLLERRQPAATVAWLLAILLLPALGLALYLAFGWTRLGLTERRDERLLARVNAALDQFRLDKRTADPEHPFITDPRTRQVVRLGRKLSRMHASVGNKCDLLVSAAATYRSMIQAFDQATDHIHVQFYIIQPDETGAAMRDRLVAKAKQGVKVRVLCDAVGSYKVKDSFWAPLHEAGGETAVFGPLGRIMRYLRRRDRFDFRNHRKVVVIDGRIAFTGGINVGREYLGLNPNLGHWRDTHVSITGPAVLALQRIFVQDWLRSTDVLLDQPRYFPAPPDEPEGDSSVQIIDSGPDRTFAPIYRLYFQCMCMAERRLWVTSPYFVPDAVIEEALVTAALRGVDVRLLVPDKSDLPIVTVAARSYYPRLLEAGVRVFEYSRGFVHAKTLVVDDWVASVGSSNMDIRSFHLNYELNAFVFGESFAKSVAESFLLDLRHAREIDLESQRRLSYWTRLYRSSARLLSPLL